MQMLVTAEQRPRHSVVAANLARNVSGPAVELENSLNIVGHQMDFL
jgi:hypothetical protein